jgi:hypothetical protein
MTFAWQGFLRVAQALVDDLDNEVREAKCRTASGRAYHAAFCTARDHVRHDLGDRNVPKRGAHQYVRDNIDRHRRTSVHYRTVAVALRRLHTDRLKADYEEEWLDQDLGEVARKAVASAKRALDHLAALRRGVNGTSPASRP